MGDQDRVNVFQRFADGSEPLAEFPHAQPGVHQDARIFGGHQRGITRTAAGQHAEFDDCRILELQNTPNPSQTKWGVNVLEYACLRASTADRVGRNTHPAVGCLRGEGKVGLTGT